jgi:phosphoenolpyruvate carboxylase
MSTQHPDNVASPNWAKDEVLAGDMEVEETYRAFSEFGCQEQMWDWEGKDADPNVVRKLLVAYPDFFKKQRLGRDIFLTIRVANPTVEKAEQKALIEALTSIPRSYDVASNFYSAEDVPPIFEVILPMTTSAAELSRVASLYETLIAHKTDAGDFDDTISAADWIGEFKPKHIEVIPLLENFESIFHADQIVSDYVRKRNLSHVRVFLARSDPALNYGMIPAVLLIKIALAKLSKLSESAGTVAYPIIGVGSLPFRGNLTPTNLDNFLQEYSGVRTVTIQSALKYDFEPQGTKNLIDTLNQKLPIREPQQLPIAQLATLESISLKLTVGYQTRVEKLADLINAISDLVPRRRERKLHIGLFGYSREIGSVRLPRAINFTAALYSIGIPPEILGLSALTSLTNEEYEMLNEIYPHWKGDVEQATNYVCWANFSLLSDDQEVISRVTRPFHLKTVVAEILSDIEEFENRTGIKVGPRTLSHRKHQNIANNTLIAFAEEASSTDVTRYIVESGRLRFSLG